jgi:D-alanyl-D-alanine carboxypeptidase (penicillin-binding protein 5/6)
MKIIFIFFCLFGFPIQFSAESATHLLSAKAYAIEDCKTNKILTEKSIHTVYPMASLTKLGTAFVSLDSLSLNEQILTPSSAIVKNSYESKADILANESYLLKDLLFGLLLASGNDVARSIATHLETNRNSFYSLSTEWRKKNGLNFYYFEEPVGLSPKSQTNIFDLLKILSLIEKNPTLFNVLQTKEYSFKSSSGKSIYVKTRTPILTFKDISIFGKTGKTKSAGLCFAGFLKNNSNLWKIAILGSNDLEKDLSKASEYVSQFQ